MLHVPGTKIDPGDPGDTAVNQKINISALIVLMVCFGETIDK